MNRIVDGNAKGREAPMVISPWRFARLIGGIVRAVRSKAAATQSRATTRNRPGGRSSSRNSRSSSANVP
jgi:hypothetical protein